MDKDILAVLEGYKRADAYMERERMERLAHMTTEESKAIFSALMAKWTNISDGESEQFRAWRLKHKIEVRKTFIRLAEAKGYL